MECGGRNCGVGRLGKVGSGSGIGEVGWSGEVRLKWGGWVEWEVGWSAEVGWR